jgi:hypothetical protein
MEKVIRKVIDPAQQDRETYLYWQSQPVGARLSASFKGAPSDDDERYQHPLKHFAQKRAKTD